MTCLHLLLSISILQPSTAMLPAPLQNTGFMTQTQQSESAQLVGTWTREKSDGQTYQKIILVLHSDETYTKKLEARVNGVPYGGTHSGKWTSQGSVVHLSGDGNWPAVDHDLTEFQRES